MAKTNWQDPKTSEVRSTHISGLQEAVGKLEESIGIETIAGTNIPLTEVYISDDDRYRIFQAPEGKRNWLSSPTPVIKKNGSTITSGFEIDYGGGAIIFASPLFPTDTLTADATYTKKIEGKGLSTNDYTDEEKDRLNKVVNDVGDVQELITDDKNNLVNAINEVSDELESHKAEKVTQAGGVHGLKIEEGTWTPVLYGTEVAGSHVYTTQIGRYYKVGKKVFIYGYINISTKDNNMAGNIRIGGLPFVSSTKAIVSIGEIRYIENTGLSFGSTSVGTDIILLKINSGANTSYVVSADVSGNPFIEFTAEYLTL